MPHLEFLCRYPPNILRILNPSHKDPQRYIEMQGINLHRWNDRFEKGSNSFAFIAVSCEYSLSNLFTAVFPAEKTFSIQIHSWVSGLFKNREEVHILPIVVIKRVRPFSGRDWAGQRQKNIPNEVHTVQLASQKEALWRLRFGYPTPRASPESTRGACTITSTGGKSVEMCTAKRLFPDGL